MTAPKQLRSRSTAPSPSRASPQRAQRRLAQPPSGGMFNRPGMHGGHVWRPRHAGFLGAGLLGMLFGNGLFGGLGGMSSMFGLILQLGLIILRRAHGDGVVAARRMHSHPPPMRAARASRYYGGPQPAPNAGYGAQTELPDRHGLRTWIANQPAAGDLSRQDYESFERLLGDSPDRVVERGRRQKLHTLATPEMVSYFARDLAENKARNDVNKVTDVKLLQGDLAEAWREGETDYASVAMRFSLVDKTLERATGRLVAGSETPTEATEVWTFARRRGGDWELSAIQQAS